MSVLADQIRVTLLMRIPPPLEWLFAWIERFARMCLVFGCTQVCCPMAHADKPVSVKYTAGAESMQLMMFVPNADKVAAMKAECYGDIFPDVAQFDIPKQYFDKILSRLNEMELDPTPDPTAREYGTILIQCTDRKNFRLCWFRGALGGGLSWNGIRVRWKGAGDNEGDMWFNPVVRSIHSKRKADSSEVTRE